MNNFIQYLIYCFNIIILLSVFITVCLRIIYRCTMKQLYFVNQYTSVNFKFSEQYLETH